MKPYSDGTIFLNYIWDSILITVFITEVGGSVVYIWALQYNV